MVSKEEQKIKTLIHLLLDRFEMYTNKKNVYDLEECLRLTAKIDKVVKEMLSSKND